MVLDLLRAILDAVSPPVPPVPPVPPAPAPAPARPKHAPGDPESYLILLGEVTRAADGQRSSVDELRTRAGLVLTAVTLVAAFLGPDELLQGSRNLWGLGAIVMAVIGILLLGWILWPTEWRFDTDWEKAISEHVEGPNPKTPGELARTLSYWLEVQNRKNKRKLGTRFIAFEVAVTLTFAQAVAWIIAINVGAS
jgi:nucleotide-binding universal stress UspA family protein